MSLSSISQLADKLPFVLFAYIGAFFPWAVVSAYDYINSEWKTVRETRRYGIINLVSTVLPLLIVLFYTAAQAAAGEYTEMSNAIVASCFIFLHIVRTLWGLWQLHTFRYWVENSIIYLRKLGMDPTLSGYEGTESVHVLSDNILVNDTIIDNQIMHGLARCHLIFSDKAIKQLPAKPIQMWLHWSTAFVAQLLPLWVRDFKALPDPSDESTGICSMVYGAQKTSEEHNHSVKSPRTNAKDAATSLGRYFGAELAASASLHLLPYVFSHQQQPEKSNNERSNKSNNISNSSDQNHLNKNNNETGNKSINIPNPFFRDEWCQQDHMHDGRIRKAEMLNFAAANASILPFNFPHDETLHRFQALRHVERLTYEPYRENLRNTISCFPIDWKNIQEMNNFDVNKLEWFLILLHMGQLASDKPMNPLDGDVLKQCPMPDNDIPFGAVSNLQSQLGMESQSILNQYALNSAISANLDPFFNLSSIPFGHHTFLLVSQSNKLVPKAGELIDIWLSLVAGQQISNMMTRTMTSQWETECYTSNCEPDPSSQKSSTRSINTVIEQARLKWRMADFDQCYGLADHYITFMGYKMEYIRSFIALLYGVFGNCETTVSSFFSTSSFTSIKINISNSSATNGNRISKEKLGNRAVQVELVWQLQNQLEKRLEEIWNQERVSKTTQSGSTTNETKVLLLDRKNEITTCLASLFVLSFPSTSVEAYDCATTFHKSAKRESVTSFCDPVIRIKAICGAQNIQLEVKKDTGESWTMTIVDQIEKLNWMRWKEAFLGRLIGCREWQKSMDLENLPDLKVSVPSHVSGGVTDLTTSTLQSFSTFSKWLPFRPAFALFEFRFKARTFREIQKVRPVQISFRMKNTVVCYSELSDRRPVHVSYEKARNSTIFENLLFIRERLGNKPLIRTLQLPDGISNILSIAEKYRHENLSRCLQVYEMAAVQYNSIEALVEYLKIVELQESVNYWISAISTIEGILQRTVNEDGRDVGLGRSLRSDHVHSILRYLNLFITEWGGMQRKEDIFNIVISLSLTASVEDSKEAFPCLLKILSYSSGSDNDISIRSEIAEYLFALYLRLQREDLLSQKFTCAEMMLERYLPRCLFENTIKIYNYNLLGHNGLIGINKLFSHMESHTIKYPTRTTSRKGFIVGKSEMLRDVHDIFLLALKNLASGILLQNVGDTEKMIGNSSPPRSTGNGRYANGQQNKLRGERRNENGLSDHDRAVMIFDFAVDENVYNEEVMEAYANRLGDGSRGITQDAERAASLYEKSIQKFSSPCAMVNLALLLRDDIVGPEVDIERVVGLLERAINEFSDTEAMWYLADMLETDRKGLPRDIERSMALYERAIEESSDSYAMTSLARLLSTNEDGVEMNISRAIQLLERAIKESSSPEAMYELGTLFEIGVVDVLEPNTRRAVQLYEQCIETEPSGVRLVRLANIFKTDTAEVDMDIERAVHLFERAITEFNDSDAMWYLANLLETEREEIPRDISRSVELYERAVEEASDVDSMNSLASLLTSDVLGVERNTKKAVQLLERAISEFCNETAMFSLAKLLENGEKDVLERNTRRAIQLYERCIETKRISWVRVESLVRMANLLKDGNSEICADVKRATKLFEIAIDEYGDTDAMWYLADLLERGKHELPRDVQRAIELYELSIEKSSDPDALASLAELLTSGVHGVELNLSRGVELLERAIKDSSHGCSMRLLAVLLWKGNPGIEHDAVRAKQLFEESLKVQRRPITLTQYAELLADGAPGVEKNIEHAKELYEAAVEEFKSAEAMEKLARLLVEGCGGLARNVNWAIELLERAVSEASYKPAMEYLAKLLDGNTPGVSADPERAADLRKRARRTE